jgi:putative membrane protein
MNILTRLLVAVVALAHLGFMVLEMFFWQSPYALSSFNMTPEYAKATAVLAANQGLYNGFLAAGLVWGVISTVRGAGISKFFLACVIIAGAFGAVTVKPSIFFVQALPAIIALLAIMITDRQNA